MLRKFKATDINWDREVDGEIVDTDLPESMEVEIDDDDNDVESLIADALTDKTGFCVHSYNFEEIN